MTVRLFVDGNLAKEERVILNESQSHYLAHVMRVRIQDNVLLFNGRDGEWSGNVVDISKKAVTLKINKQNYFEVIIKNQISNNDKDFKFKFNVIEKRNTFYDKIYIVYEPGVFS